MNSIILTTDAVFFMNIISVDSFFIKTLAVTLSYRQKLQSEALIVTKTVHFFNCLKLYFFVLSRVLVIIPVPSRFLVSAFLSRVLVTAKTRNVPSRVLESVRSVPSRPGF